MTEVKVLELLRDMVQDSVVSLTESDDPSGVYTKYLVDQERLMANIEERLKEAKCQA